MPSDYCEGLFKKQQQQQQRLAGPFGIFFMYCTWANGVTLPNNKALSLSKE
jgi:hypothetical protein